MNADEAVRARCRAAKFSSLQNLHTFTAQQIAPFTFLARREAKPPNIVSIVEAIDDVCPARRRNELSNQCRIAKWIRHMRPAIGGKFMHGPARDFYRRLSFRQGHGAGLDFVERPQKGFSKSCS